MIKRLTIKECSDEFLRLTAKESHDALMNYIDERLGTRSEGIGFPSFGQPYATWIDRLYHNMMGSPE